MLQNPKEDYFFHFQHSLFAYHSLLEFRTPVTFPHSSLAGLLLLSRTISCLDCQITERDRELKRSKDGVEVGKGKVAIIL